MRSPWVLLVCPLTLYPLLELTRLIIVGLPNADYWGIPVWHFMMELVVMWVFYIAGMVLVYRKIK